MPLLCPLCKAKLPERYTACTQFDRTCKDCKSKWRFKERGGYLEVKPRPDENPKDVLAWCMHCLGDYDPGKHKQCPHCGKR